MTSGGPAFPHTEYYDEKPVGHVAGLSMRDYFAAKAMPALIAEWGEPPYDMALLAKRAYSIADAMIEAKDKESL